MWIRAVQALSEREEWERFSDLELSVQQIFFLRQQVGLRLDRELVQTFVEAAKAEKYDAYVRIAEAIQVSPTGLTFRNVKQYLPHTDAAHLEEFCDSGNIEEHFKIAAETSSFAADVIQFIRASRDVTTLNRMMVPEGRIHPFFHVMGTVTSRILVSEPYLQQLRKKYRGVMCADEGHDLVYLDYRQFEPGIMAHLSGDASFIEAYNSSDLYSALSAAVFGTDDHRGQCKRVFLAFCYGMTKSGLATLMAGKSPEADVKGGIEDRLNKFFEKYAGLEALRSALEGCLHAEGFVSSVLGNRRYRTKTGPLTPEERRWSMSQRIQGTASLIFKEALRDIANALSPDCILLPMHDAVLLQFPHSHAAEMTTSATEIMTNAFARRCPTIHPKISQEPFAG